MRRRRDNDFLSFKSVYSEIQHTKGEVHHKDGTVQRPSASDDLLGGSSTSMDVASSVSGKAELHAYMRVQQVSKDTCPLMWWKQQLHKYTLKACVIKSQFVKNALPSMYSVCVCVNCTSSSDKTCETKVRQIFLKKENTAKQNTGKIMVSENKECPPSQKSHALFSLILADTNKTASITPYQRA